MIFPSKQHRDQFLATLRAYGVTRITLGFSGSGDSGNFDAVQAYGNDETIIDISPLKMEWPVKYSEFKNNQYIVNTKNESLTYARIIENMANHELDAHGYDWYNNEGGQGEFTVDLTESPPQIELGVSINVMKTLDYSHDYSDEFADDEDKDTPCTPATTP